ncbi:MAG: 30S ribosomal protein S16 [Patescibacteria group bacterium]|nr:30S ribosomal protein S16 [Patescibacteria group bacterium]
MLAIRFQRTGRNKQPYYRVVVSEKTKDMYGRHLEILGTYNPRSKEIALKVERIKYWLEKGAQASDVVFNLFVREGILAGKKRKAVAISKRRQAKQAEAQKAKEKDQVPADQVGSESESKTEPEAKAETESKTE